jgi:hypothetical protein
MPNVVVCVGRSSILVVMVVLVAGCGDGKPTRVPISGKVLIDGKPLAMGSIVYVPQGARPSGSAIDKEGHFVLTCYQHGDGAVLGAHRVSVTAAQNIGETAIRWETPKMYADITTSGLIENVDGPADDVVINLTWKGGKPFVERLQ